ncbi:MAG: hypothetical protein KJ915_13975, partial [Candidatus Omnitrophica bacterium]|nr:hypothetical protein [Candidatus Omnitrophota bacterium]
YKKCGLDEEAKQIQIKKNDDKAKIVKMHLSTRIWHYWLKWIIGYGYKPQNALYISLIIIMIGWFIFGAAFKYNIMSKTYTILTVSEDSRNTEIPYIQHIPNALVYSIDTFIPLIDLHQGKYWLPTKNHRVQIPILKKWFFNINGTYLMAFHVIYTILGWILTTFFIFSLSGLIKM